MTKPARPPLVDPRWLHEHPLPPAEPGGDKEGRGHVLVVAGSREMPGAAVLAAVAALRAGAGKLTVLTDAEVAIGIGMVLPEGRVVGAERDGRSFDAGALVDLCAGPSTPAVALVGPGMAEAAAASLALQAMRRLPALPLVLDAAAMQSAVDNRVEEDRSAPILLTPHAGELAGLCGWRKDDVVAHPQRAAQHLARLTGSFVLLKGPTTVLADSTGVLWEFRSEQPGLGTSGSGDVLAGIVAGLLARGASVQGAAAWGVAIHSQCAVRLASSVDLIGFLGRELAAEVPRAARDLARMAAEAAP